MRVSLAAPPRLGPRGGLRASLGKEPSPWGGGGTEAAPRQAESYWVWNREAAAAAAPRGGRSRRAHGAPRPRRQRAPSRPGRAEPPQHSAWNLLALRPCRS